MMSNTRRRVKLYVLNEERQWDDHGTGHVSSMYVDHDKLRGIVLLVRSEEDGSVLLESRIQTDTVYQKQQDTLIVWSEGESDLALSFQEKDGCDEIWEKICQVQGKDPSVDITQDVPEEEEEQFEEVPDYSAPIELPPCELSRLEEMSELFAGALPSPLQREKLATALEQESFLKKLFDLFHMCEDLENAEGLHHLYEIFKTIFMLNKNSLFEVMFTEESIFDVVGILEYDPNRKGTVKHRQFLKEKACFKEVIPISNKDLLMKIHQTYRVQYIQDILVPVPSVFDENMSTLSSFIFFNKIEIVNMIQEDDRFLSELFSRLTDDEISDDKRRDLVLFLKELCNLSQTLQQQSRAMFLKSLSVHGLLQTLETLLNLEDEIMKSAIIDILCCVVEYIPSLVREYLVKEANRVDEIESEGKSARSYLIDLLTTELFVVMDIAKECTVESLGVILFFQDSLLINMLIDQMICDADNSTAVTLLYLLRTLLDPENMGLGNNKMEKTEFLSFFYKHSMHILTAPLLAATAAGEKPSRDDPKTAATLEHILDILSFCVEHHTYHIKNYILSKDLLRRVLILMYSGHKYLALAALRFLRRIIGAKDEFYNRYIARGKLLDPVIKAFDHNGEKYNLLNSAVLELFEYIRVEDIKSLCTYIVESHQSIFQKVDYVETFKGLQIRYDQEKDRQSKCLSDRNSNHGIIHVNSARFRRDTRDLEEDEEIWFDSEEDEFPSAGSSPTEQSHGLKPMNVKLKDVDLIDNLPLRRNTPSPPLVGTVNSGHSPIKNNIHVDSQPKVTPTLTAVNSSVNSVNTRKLPIGGLVDYPDDDDDDIGSSSDEDIAVSPAKKPRLTNATEN